MQLEHLLDNLLFLDEERADDPFANSTARQNATVRTRHTLLVLRHVLVRVRRLRDARDAVDLSVIAGRRLRTLRLLRDILNRQRAAGFTKLANAVGLRGIRVPVGWGRKEEIG